MELQGIGRRQPGRQSLFAPAADTGSNTALYQSASGGGDVVDAVHPMRGLHDPSTIIDPWRSTLISVTEMAFPRARELYLHRQPAKQQVVPQLGDVELRSSLPLSMALYFNKAYLLFWLPLTLAALILKFDGLTSAFRAVNISLYILLLLLEVGRIHLGNQGNFLEEVPELALSWVITTFFQTPLLLFMSFNELSDMGMRPEERGANIPLAAQAIAQILVMRMATNNLIHCKIAKMRLNPEFDKLANMPPADVVVPMTTLGMTTTKQRKQWSAPAETNGLQQDAVNLYQEATFVTSADAPSQPGHSDIMATSLPGVITE